MPKPSLDWQKMYQQLADYHRRYGHANVPSNWKGNRQLGRWVATLRYRNKTDGLPAAQVAKLNALGFVWAPTDAAWEKMFQELLAFKKRFGNTNVPTQWPENLHLANWVANQRHRKKKGTLSPERIKRLDQIAFEWAIYGQANSARKARERHQRVAANPAQEPPVLEQRLYNLGHGDYVQYDGGQKVPAELRKYMEAHRGDYPPYFPLPGRVIRFRLNEETAVRVRTVSWQGKGRLPRSVLEYVRENGVLPPYE